MFPYASVVVFPPEVPFVSLSLGFTAQSTNWVIRARSVYLTTYFLGRPWVAVCGDGVVYSATRRPTDIVLQLNKVCYPCSRECFYYLCPHQRAGVGDILFLVRILSASA